MQDDSFQAIFQAMVPPEQAGKRLDAALRALFPFLSVRAAQRLTRERTITRNDRPISPRALLQAGDQIRILPPSVALGPLFSAARVIIVRDGLAALEKPAGLHSVSLHGGKEASLEAGLPGLLAAYPGEWTSLNRLDKATSGIVLAGASPEAARLFRQAENSGKARKVYYAIVHGEFLSSDAILITTELDTARTSRSKLLDRPDPDPLRHTFVEPLRAVEPASLAPFTSQPLLPPLTLVRCVIKKGRRHQIRAHLASTAHPIVGDPLYGSAPEGARLFLHHASISLPGFEADCPIAWADEE